MFQRKQESRKLGRGKLSSTALGYRNREGRERECNQCRFKNPEDLWGKVSDLWPGIEMYVCKVCIAKQLTTSTPTPNILSLSPLRAVFPYLPPFFPQQNQQSVLTSVCKGARDPGKTKDACKKANEKGTQGKFTMEK